MDTFIVDTNVWIDYFNGDARLKKKLDESTLITPLSVVLEMSIVLRRDGHSEQVRKKALNAICKKSIVRSLKIEDAERVSELVINGKLHFADALAYVGTNPESHFLTSDRDFEGKSFVQFVR